MRLDGCFISFVEADQATAYIQVFDLEGLYEIAEIVLCRELVQDAVHSVR